MTCYMRQMHWLFEALDLEYDEANRRRVDEAIRAELGIDEGMHCPEVWAAIKALDEDAQLDLAPAIRGRLG